MEKLHRNPTHGIPFAFIRLGFLSSHDTFIINQIAKTVTAISRTIHEPT